MAAAPDVESAPHPRRDWIARQPILDRASQTWGYEVLFRSSPVNRASFDDPSEASAQALLTAFTEVGFDALCGPRAKAVFHLRDELLTSDAFEALPRHRVLLHVGRCPQPDEPLTARLRELSKAGYRLVLPGDAPGADALLELAEVITLDMRGPRARFEARAATLRGAGARVLARRVETREEHRAALDAGCQLVEGYFFRVPEMIATAHVPASRQVALRLVAAAQSEQTPLAELERLIRADATLSYRLLRLLSTPRFSTHHKVDSVRRAVVMLGRRKLAKWVTLIALSGVDDQPAALLEQAVVRARMCELLGEAQPVYPPAAFFTAGLLSVVDAMLGRPLAELLAEIPLSDELAQALLRRTNPIGQALEAVAAYERGEWRAVDLDAHDPARLADAYFEAARYGVELLAELGCVR